ncbi:MAG: WbqC family protein [Pseudomonadota bacterium]
MTKTIGIIQPNFLPWRGYFDFIDEVDEFILLDDVKFTPRDWRNRNRIRTRDGRSKWLTVPIINKHQQPISEARTSNHIDWRQRHASLLVENYGKAPFYEKVIGQLFEIYRQSEDSLLTLNVKLIHWVMSLLEIETPILMATDLNVSGDKNSRLIEICRRRGATRYLSGASAQAYLDATQWSDAGISVAFKCYKGYPEYQQIAEPFDPFVSVLDLLLMIGPDAKAFLARP